MNNKTARAARFNARLDAARATDKAYAAAVARCEAENVVLRAQNARDEARLVDMLKKARLRERPECEDFGCEG